MAGMLAVIMLLGQGCAISSVLAPVLKIRFKEQIDESAIIYIQPPNAFVPASLTQPAVRAELPARNATGLSQRVSSDVFFDFDGATIREDALPLLNATATRLNPAGASQVMLEGRGDEAGTAAYNIVLSDRRAKREVEPSRIRTAGGQAQDDNLWEGSSTLLSAYERLFTAEPEHSFCRQRFEMNDGEDRRPLLRHFLPSRS